MEIRDRTPAYSSLVRITLGEEGVLSPTDRDRFQQAVITFYTRYGRPFPWRETSDPYHILVSEIMLQQTQTSRVTEKFPQFIRMFPSFRALARSPLDKVVREWQGLGYNRRAKAVHTISRIVTADFSGELPNDIGLLESFPMIGKATARSIAAFAFNEPVVFIETNIRCVFMYTFFENDSSVTDKQVLPLVEATLYRKNPRTWYNALMDYGVHIKKMFPEVSLRSAAYTKQAPFKRSNRQLRGLILKSLAETETAPLTFEQLAAGNHISGTDFSAEQIRKTARELEKEGFITISGAGCALSRL